MNGKLTENQCAWAIEIYRTSYTVQEIADALGVSRKTMQRFFEKTFGSQPGACRNKKPLIYEENIKHETWRICEVGWNKTEDEYPQITMDDMIG